MKYIMTILQFAVCYCGQSQNAGIKDTLVIPKLNFDSAGELKIVPSATSSNKDFDFFAGKWKLLNRTLRKNPDGSSSWREFEATMEMQIVLNGIGNTDRFFTTVNGKPYEGMTIRLFNPKTRLWSIYWAESNLGTLGLPPVIGSFENKVGYFFSKDLINGKYLITIYRWDARVADKPVWSQGSSEDNGINWEWNWHMYFTKAK